MTFVLANDQIRIIGQLVAKRTIHDSMMTYCFSTLCNRMVLYDVWFANDLDGLELALGKRMVSKGTCQKRFSGFFPLRGGGGTPQFH